MHVGYLRGGHRAEDQRRDDAEAAGAGPPQGPEQLLVMVIVDIDDPAVREDDLRPQQVVGRDAVPATEDPEPASQRDAGDAHARTRALGDRQAALLQRIVDLARRGARLDGHDVAGHRHQPHRRDVDDHASRRGPPGEAVAARAGRRGEAVAADERERLAAVLGRFASDDGGRNHVVVPSVEGAGKIVVRVRAGQDDAAGDRRLVRRPIGRRVVCSHGSPPSCGNAIAQRMAEVLSGITADASSGTGGRGSDQRLEGGRQPPPARRHSPLGFQAPAVHAVALTHA
jgi:hypothetical protein